MMLCLLPLSFRSRVRSLVAVAAVASAAFVAAPASTVHAAATDADPQTRQVVDLQLEIATGGQSVARIAQLLELDTDTSLALSSDGHEHAVDIIVRKADERGRKLSVTLEYLRDGQAVLETVSVEAPAKKAKIVRSEEGDVALKFTLAPRTVTAEEVPPPPRRRPKIDIVEDTNDPLAGLE